MSVVPGEVVPALAPKASMTNGEEHVAHAVMFIAACDPDGLAPFSRCYAVIPHLIALNATQLAGSTTRNGEPMWFQQVRNLRSHHRAGTNYVGLGLLEHVPRVGYRITDEGRAYARDIIASMGWGLGGAGG